jgi:hypothetical protein
MRNVTKVTNEAGSGRPNTAVVACVTKFLEERVALSLYLPLDGSLQRSNCPDLPQLSGSRRVVVSPSSKISHRQLFWGNYFRCKLCDINSQSGSAEFAAKTEELNLVTLVTCAIRSE